MSGRLFRKDPSGIDSKGSVLRVSHRCVWALQKGPGFNPPGPYWTINEPVNQQLYLMSASFRTSWILQGQSALLHCLSLGVCRRWNGCIYRMEKDEQKTMLLVTSFCLLSCLRETHSESTDEGSNSSCGWEKWGVCLPPVHWATWLFRVHVSSSLYWCRAYGELLILCLAFRPVNTFDLSTQLKKPLFIQVWLKEGITSSWMRWGWGIFHWVFMGNFTFNFIPTEK